MYRRISAVIIVQICFFSFIRAQDSVIFKSQHLFSICTGISYHIIRDNVISPDIYSGVQAPLYINYRYIGIKSRQTFSFYFDKVKLESAIPDLLNGLSHYTENVNVLLDYSYNLRFYTFPKYQVQCFIGGKFKSLLNFRDHFYLSSGDEFIAEQFNSIDINVTLEKRFFTNNDLLYFNINIPLVTYSLLNNIYNSKVSDSEELIINNPNNIIWHIIKNGEIITFNKLFEFQTELSYTKIISRHFGIELKYKLHYYSFAQYKDLLYSKYLNAQYLLGLMIKI